MLENGAASESPVSEKQSVVLGERAWSMLLCPGCLIILFHGLSADIGVTPKSLIKMDKYVLVSNN